MPQVLGPNAGKTSDHDTSDVYDERTGRPQSVKGKTLVDEGKIINDTVEGQKPQGGNANVDNGPDSHLPVDKTGVPGTDPIQKELVQAELEGDHEENDYDDEDDYFEEDLGDERGEGVQNTND